MGDVVIYANSLYIIERIEDFKVSIGTKIYYIKPLSKNEKLKPRLTFKSKIEGFLIEEEYPEYYI